MTPPVRSRGASLLLPICLAAAGCAEKELDATQSGAALPSVTTNLPYEVEGWRADFPYEIHVPPHRSAWYDRSANDALDKVIENLSGQCTKTAWLMSKEFFDRHWDRAADLLIERLDATQRKNSAYDHAENIINAMGRCKKPLFARALERAASHSHPGIRTAVFRALRLAGDASAVVAVGQGFTRMNKTEQIDWLEAAAEHLDDKRLFELFRPLLTQHQFAHLNQYAFDLALKLPAKRAAALFDDKTWRSLPADLQLHVAGKMHEAGDGRGTTQLRHAMQPPVENEIKVIVAIQGAMRGDVKPFVDDLLLLTNEDFTQLNILVIEALRRIPGQNVTNALQTMTDRSKDPAVRHRALAALAARGETSELDEILEQVRKSPMNDLFRAKVFDLAGAQFVKAIPVLLERAKKVAGDEEIYFIKTLAAFDCKESFQALSTLFMRPEFRYESFGGRHTNVTYSAVLLANIGSAVPEMLAFLRQLPASDYRRRAAMIHVLANIAGANPDKASTPDIYAALREILFDRKQEPQVRMLALDYLRKDVRLADAMKLKTGLGEEKPGLRRYFSDYLTEFF